VGQENYDYGVVVQGRALQQDLILAVFSLQRLLPATQVLITEFVIKAVPKSVSLSASELITE
jgi:hypothetical protein